MTRSPVRKTMLVALAALLQLLFAPRGLPAGACAPTGAPETCCCCQAPGPAAPGGSCCTPHDGVDSGAPRPDPGPCGCEDDGDHPDALPETVTPERTQVAIGEPMLVATCAPLGQPAEGHRRAPVPRARAPVRVLYCVYLI